MSQVSSAAISEISMFLQRSATPHRCQHKHSRRSAIEDNRPNPKRHRVVVSFNNLVIAGIYSGMFLGWC